MPSTMPKPPYDPEMAAFLAANLAGAPDITLSAIPAMRKIQDEVGTAEIALSNLPTPFTHSEQTIRGPDGNDLILSIFKPEKTNQHISRPPPCIYYMHGGGFFCGNRFTYVREILLYAIPVGATVVSIEYRQTPEYRYPCAMEDCYAGLKWTSDHAHELGICADRILVSGQSAGGNLAAAVVLLARDRHGPKIVAQLLDCPMLDDRAASLSTKQFVGEGTWSAGSNKMAWGAYLGPNAGGASVSQYAAPARAEDLSGLPPAFISVGSAEVFRDESVEYAHKLWAAGVQCELHVWPGGFHCFEALMATHPGNQKEYSAEGLPHYRKFIDIKSLEQGLDRLACQ